VRRDKTTATTASTSASSASGLRSPQDLAQRIIPYALRPLPRDIAPWKETVHLTIEKETSRDKTVKTRMKEAEALVKARRYAEALEVYDQVYQDTGSFAAGYNAAFMREVVGDLNGAIALMSGLAADGNPRALAALDRMQSSGAAAQAVEALRTGGTLRDRAIQQAAGGLLEALGAMYPGGGAKVAVMSPPGRDQDGGLLDYAAGKVTESLKGGGVTVVDRGQNAALVDMERVYQVSGAVSDEEMVSIGNEYGVGVMIFLSITGAGSLRQLKVEVVSVETSEQVYTKAFDI